MPPAYRHIGVASTFSPRFLAVLAEADRIARRFAGPLSIVHAASEDAERAARFDAALAQLRRDLPTPVLWSDPAQGQQPSAAIVAACQMHQVDLLLAGALERETEHRNFIGGVARDLLQHAPCDLLLIPKPDETVTASSVIAVEVDLDDASVDSLTRACEIATCLGAAELVFIAVVTPFDEAKAAARKEPARSPEDRLAEIVDQASGFTGAVDVRVIRSNTGFAVCDFVQDSNVDFLIVIARQDNGARVLPPHMDWLLQVIPSNVLLLTRKD